MKQLSTRHIAAIEVPSGGGNVGISSSVRKFWRKHFSSVPAMLGPNDSVNYQIALDAANAQPQHRFLLRSGEVAEIRKSHTFVYIVVLRKTGRQDVIVIQPSFKEAPEEIKKQRMTKEWLDKVFRGEIKRKVK